MAMSSDGVMVRYSPGCSWVFAKASDPICVRTRPVTWLPTAAKRKWAELVPLLERMGVLTEIDAGALARYCVIFARYQQTEVALAKDDTPTEQRPFLERTAFRLSDHLGKLEHQFGLTPNARERLSRPHDRLSLTTAV